MAGTKEGGLKAAATNKKEHGEDFYARIGRKGGRNGHTGGFAANRELAREAGRKGGMISRRGPARKDGKDSQHEREDTIPKTPEHGKSESISQWYRIFSKNKDAAHLEERNA